jgi:hypothetical protein
MKQQAYNIRNKKRVKIKIYLFEIPNIYIHINNII